MNHRSLQGAAIVAALTISAGALGEIRMKYPFLDGESTLSSTYATHWGGQLASDVDFSGHPVVHAPISGEVVKVVEHFADNTLPGSQLPDNCTDYGLGYGNQIRIRAGDGTVVLLAHLRQYSVIPELGATVSAGQPIAEGGASGYVCASDTGIGDHTHIEYIGADNVKVLPPDRLCEPIIYPPDDAGTCDVGNGSEVPTCFDGEKNGNETEIDCGGNVCPPCQPTQTAIDDFDAGHLHTCVVDNTWGQLGNGTSSISSIWYPVRVKGAGVLPWLSADWLPRKLGFGHSCVLHAGGSIDCWGDTSLGQVSGGDPTPCASGDDRHCFVLVVPRPGLLKIDVGVAITALNGPEIVSGRSRPFHLELKGEPRCPIHFVDKGEFVLTTGSGIVVNYTDWTRTVGVRAVAEFAVQVSSPTLDSCSRETTSVVTSDR